jgi:hypothetical protein
LIIEHGPVKPRTTQRALGRGAKGKEVTEKNRRFLSVRSSARVAERRNGEKLSITGAFFADKRKKKPGSARLLQ